MRVRPEEVAGIASLARLRLEAEELERITQELNKVLDHVETLKGLSVDDIPREANPLEGEGDALRGEGAETPDAGPDALDTMAPDAREGFFAVPPLPGVHAEDEG